MRIGATADTAYLGGEQKCDHHGTGPKQQEQRHGDLGPHVMLDRHVDPLPQTSPSVSLVGTRDNVAVEILALPQ
jgi:hypothetical protein